MTGRTRKLFLALLAAIPLLLSCANLPAQTAQSGNQSQTDSSAAGKTAKLKTGDSTKDAAASASSPSKASTAPSSPDSNAATSGPSSKTQTQPATTGMVWVNTDSGVYHKPGSRWYGKTKKGKYMLEADAIKAGYKLAK